MENTQLNITPKRKKFNEQHDGLSDSEMLREHLYAQQLIYDKLEKIRANTKWIYILV